MNVRYSLSSKIEFSAKISTKQLFWGKKIKYLRFIWTELLEVFQSTCEDVRKFCFQRSVKFRHCYPKGISVALGRGRETF